MKSAHASASDWQTAADTCLADLRPIPAGANLGFVYLTDAIADSIEPLVEYLRAATDIEHWVGSVGMGVCGTATEYYDRPALSLLIGEFPEGSFQVFEPLISGVSSFENQHGSWLRANDPYFGVVHADPRNSEVPALIDELSNRWEAVFW